MSTLNSYLKSIGAEVYTSDRENAGCLIITNAIGSKRWRMSKSLKDALPKSGSCGTVFHQ